VANLKEYVREGIRINQITAGHAKEFHEKRKARGWLQLVHSMRAGRQTELQREFPLPVVCSWPGNSPRSTQQSYLLVTKEDVVRAAEMPENGHLYPIQR